MRDILQFVGVVNSNNQVINLAKLISDEESEAKLLSKQTMQSLGIKGSPKLTKVLIQMGLNSKTVSMLLSPKQSQLMITGDPELISEQGNSIHYRSCQSTDDRAKFAPNEKYWEWEEDMEIAGELMFMAYTGLPMSQDGKGFTSRTKLRLMFKDGEVAGLFLDRPYGQVNLIKSNMGTIREWWNTYSKEQGWPQTPLLIPPVWERDDGQSSDFEKSFGGTYPEYLECPSARYGYQDCLTREEGPYSCFQTLEKLEAMSLLEQAYRIRAQQPISYRTPLRECYYNPQKGGLVVPVKEVPSWRGFISKEMKFYIHFLRKVLNLKPKNFRLVNGYSGRYIFNLPEVPNPFYLEESRRFNGFEIQDLHADTCIQVKYEPIEEEEEDSKDYYWCIKVVSELYKGSELRPPSSIASFILAYEFRLGCVDKLEMNHYKIVNQDNSIVLNNATTGSTHMVHISADGTCYTVLCNDAELGLMKAIPLPPTCIGQYKDEVIGEWNPLYFYNGKKSDSPTGSDISLFILEEKLDTPYQVASYRNPVLMDTNYGLVFLNNNIGKTWQFLKDFFN